MARRCYPLRSRGRAHWGHCGIFTSIPHGSECPAALHPLDPGVLMAPGFRYHVVTIAAIFLALGVGIVIGSSFVQSPIVDRLTRQLGSLNEQFKRDVVPLQESNRQYASFVDAITPLMLAGKLAGVRVALIQTGDYPETE